MSQEINLLNPALRHKRDWLAFDMVAGGAGVAVLLVVALYAYSLVQARTEQQRQAALAEEVQVGQKELQAATAQLAARKTDPMLEQEAVRLKNAATQRKELFRLATGFASSGSGGVADVMRGFSRQIVDGVWLTGFVVAPDDFEIRGRLLDSSLLPAYIRRLNAEPAFRGRRFVALDMRAVAEDAAAAGTASAGVANAAAKPAVVGAVPRYTEFVLRASAAATSPAGGRP